MVGPDKVVSSGGARTVEPRPGWTEHDAGVHQEEEEESDYDAEHDGTAVLSDVDDVSCDAVDDVDVVQVMTRRLSVTPPTDDEKQRCSSGVRHECPALLMAAASTGASTEVNNSLLLSPVTPW